MTAAEDLTQMTHDPAQYWETRARAKGGAEHGPADATWAMLAYLGAIFLGPVIPLLVFALRRNKSPYLRYHAVRSVNLTVTAMLYVVSCAIIGGMLALDTITVGLVVGLVLLFTLWVIMLKYLIRGVVAAQRGEPFDVPGWICATITQ